MILTRPNQHCNNLRGGINEEQHAFDACYARPEAAPRQETAATQSRARPAFPNRQVNKQPQRQRPVKGTTGAAVAARKRHRRA